MAHFSFQILSDVRELANLKPEYLLNLFALNQKTS